MDTGIMAARSVQISLDEELLEEIDRRPETKRKGRSAVIRRALYEYLRRQREQEIDRSYEEAYDGKADEIYTEFAELLGSQTWPEE